MVEKKRHTVAKPRTKKALNTKPQKKVVRKSKPKSTRKKKDFFSVTQNLWLRYSLVIVIIISFAYFFYIFALRPYSYRWRPCNGYKGYGVCIPYGYTIHGVDISHYQGIIDWNSFAFNRDSDFPIHFIFMKATEGGDFVDSHFKNNFDSAASHGFIRGAYHFYNPRTSIVKQAQSFIKNVKLRRGDLPPVLDIETRGKKSKEQIQKDVLTWMEIMETHYQIKPILYTSYKFRINFLSDSVFNDYPYWIAHYYVDSLRYKGKWDFWQHTDCGTIPGIEGKVDLNVFNGSREQLDFLLLK